jgi:hypothetical protein
MLLFGSPEARKQAIVMWRRALLLLPLLLLLLLMLLLLLLLLLTLSACLQGALSDAIRRRRQQLKPHTHFERCEHHLNHVYKGFRVLILFACALYERDFAL